MRKLLLIIALTLLWSFSANAQLQTETKATKAKATKISETLPESSSPNCRTHYTAPEAYKNTADGNVNTFSAIYSGVTARTCEDKALEDARLDERVSARADEFDCTYGGRYGPGGPSWAPCR